ncbi:MAG: sigma-54-dependent Fis family transcriptional regulator [Deltaproteobacteria bacterium]|nr:sigma-54-dependent Fis family transcriptional regulator [Deltaproteobacteria bacterium]
MSVKTKVLVVDDNEEGLFALEQMLQKHDFATVTASSGQEALKKIESENPDIVLLDVNMPGMDGYEVTRRVKEDAVLRYIPIILVTASDTLESLVQGFELGADDYVRRPFDSSELLARLSSATRKRRLYEELRHSNRLNSELQSRISDQVSFSNIIGGSQVMRELFSLISKIKDSDVSVLITGESGTGKELVASAVHYNSPRRNKPFVVQNCSAFNDNLLESELFGHVRGAFTGAVRDKQGLFEVADGGTFFLDELGEMSAALQVKLLRVLQDGTFTPVGATKAKKVDVRIIAATNRDLKQMVAAGTFREDLYYRLNVVNLKLPALRERRVDIPLLASFFLQKIADKSKQAPKHLSPDALRLLSDYDWPGNIRELQNEIERLALMAGGETEIGAALVASHIAQKSTGGPTQGKRLEGNLKDALENLEKNMILAALEQVDGNKSEAAKNLGISRSNLIAKVKAYGLS